MGRLEQRVKHVLTGAQQIAESGAVCSKGMEKMQDVRGKAEQSNIASHRRNTWSGLPVSGAIDSGQLYMRHK